MKGKRGTRHSYSAVMADIRACMRAGLHVPSRSHQQRDNEGGRSQVIECVNCGKTWAAVVRRLEQHSNEYMARWGWKPLCRLGDRCTDICPAVPVGLGEGI